MSSLAHAHVPENLRRADADDVREALYNGGSTGTLVEIQRSEPEISSLEAIVFDLDPHLLQPGNAWFPPANDPFAFHEAIRPVLDRHPIANRAEVRATGTGLHIIRGLARPLTFDTRDELLRGRALTGLIQSTLPIDPASPGITMLTRPLGSINSKNGREVVRIRDGVPIPIADLEDLAQEVSRSPFEVLGHILVGGAACPICGPGGRLFGGTQGSARCYRCGEIPLSGLLSLPYRMPEGDDPAREDDVSPTSSRSPRGRQQRRNVASWATGNPTGEALMTRLFRYLEDWRRISRRGGRVVIEGVTTRGEFRNGIAPAQQVLREALINARCFYSYGDAIVYDEQEGRRLIPIIGGSRVTQEAPDVIQRYLVLEAHDGAQHFLDGGKLTRLLADPGLRDGLPRITYYSRRPTFDRAFRLCEPGWNPGVGYLVHADPVEVPDLSPAHDGALIDRLPPHVWMLLGEFAWEADADLVHAVALLLTGLLVDQFVQEPHPLGLILGDRPGVGKTLLARVIGMVMDGREPRILTHTHREELPKVLGAHIDGERPSIILFDNIRGRVDSDFLEAQSVSPTVSVRRLGTNQMIEVPNAMLWLFTSNQASLTPDLISRCLPVRLAGGEATDRRDYAGNPLEVAQDHRSEIFGELVAMVRRWDDDGRPRPSAPSYRFRNWAGTIGGILGNWGLGGPFLANLAETRERVDPEHASLLHLARAIAGREQDPRHLWRGSLARSVGLHATGWLNLAIEAGGSLGRVASSTRVEDGASALGRYLRRLVGRQVEIEHDGRRLRARFFSNNHAGTRYYFEFEVVGDSPMPG